MANRDKSKPVLTGEEISVHRTRPDPPLWLWRGWKRRSSSVFLFSSFPFSPGSSGLGDTRVCIVLCWDFYWERGVEPCLVEQTRKCRTDKAFFTCFPLRVSVILATPWPKYLAETTSRKKGFLWQMDSEASQPWWRQSVTVGVA